MFSLQISKLVFNAQDSMDNVGALTECPSRKMFRVRIGFRQKRKMLVRGRSMIAPTFKTKQLAKLKFAQQKRIG